MSKKEKREIARLKNLIGSDRKTACSNFDDLLSQDISALLKDYFDLEGEVKFMLDKEGDRYLLTISTLITRIKNFYTPPK